MIKIIAYTIVNLIFINTFAKGPYKKVTIRNENPYSIEKFFVLKNDENIREGEYRKLGYGKRLLETGFYNKNLKDSLWKQFLNGEKYMEGLYDKGKRVGKWSYFFKNTLLYEYDFQKDSLCFYNTNFPLKSHVKVNRIKVNDEWITSFVDTPPLFLKSVIQYYIGKNVNYPKEAAINGKQGTILISVIVSKTGQTSEPIILKGKDKHLDQAALDVVEKLTDWHPAIYNGNKVDCEIIIPVSFLLK